MFCACLLEGKRWNWQAATEPLWHIPDAVCTVLDSWWWTEKPSETCRALFQNKINLRYCAPGWFYFFFFRWRYSPLWALACRTIPLHFSLSITSSLHLLTPSTWRSLSTSSFHHFLGLPLRLVPSSSWVKIFLGILFSSILSRWPSQLILCHFIHFTIFSPLLNSSSSFRPSSSNLSSLFRIYCDARTYKRQIKRSA